MIPTMGSERTAGSSIYAGATPSRRLQTPSCCHAAGGNTGAGRSASEACRLAHVHQWMSRTEEAGRNERFRMNGPYEHTSGSWDAVGLHAPWEGTDSPPEPGEIVSTEADLSRSVDKSQRLGIGSGWPPTPGTKKPTTPQRRRPPPLASGRAGRAGRCAWSGRALARSRAGPRRRLRPPGRPAAGSDGRMTTWTKVSTPLRNWTR